MKPAGYFVLIKQDEIEEKSKGGIILTQNAVGINQAQQTVGTILARGDVAFTGGDWGKGDRDMLCPGAKVVFKKHAGQRFKPKNAMAMTDPYYHVCHDSDVFGLAEDDLEFGG